MNHGPKLTIDYLPCGRNGSATVTARQGDDILAHEKVDFGKSEARARFADDLAKSRPGIDREDLDKELLRIGADLSELRARVDQDPAQPSPEELLAKMPEHVRREARAMLESPDLMKRTIDDVETCGVAGERELVAAIHLVAISRLLPRPLSAIIQAPSSVGKSFVADKTTALCPPEVVIRATAMTPNALFYLPPGSLRHKFIVAGERSRREDDDSAEATRALREMLSSGRLSKLLPVKEGNKYVTRLIEQDGPIAFLESTTLTNVFNEDSNRCLLLAADERKEQTKAVVDRLAAAYSGESLADVDAIVERHHAAQRMLQQRSVIIPFANQIAAGFDTSRVEARRLFHLMGMVEASALLHQFQRETDDEGRIVARVDDYQLARHLCSGPLARLLGGRISDAAIRYHERLATWATGLESFTTTDAVKRDRASDRAVRGWLHELAGAGAVEQLSESKGSRPATWRFTAIDRAELEVADCGLPAQEALESELLIAPSIPLPARV